MADCEFSSGEDYGHDSFVTDEATMVNTVQSKEYNTLS
jgi:hypothetical protein